VYYGLIDIDKCEKICFAADMSVAYQFVIVAQTNPENQLKNQRNLMRLWLLKQKKRLNKKADRTIF
jgi:hypothetical protein